MLKSIVMKRMFFPILLMLIVIHVHAQVRSEQQLNKTANGNQSVANEISTDDIVRRLTIQNSDKIVFFGSSFTESAYAVKNKSWVNKIAQMTDWIVANGGQSGNRIVDIVRRIRANNGLYHPTIGIRELSPTVVIMANSGNETLTKWPNLDYYRHEIMLALQHVKELGAEMVIGTEQMTQSDVEIMLYGLADELGIEAHTIGNAGSKILNQNYKGFWAGSHHATRNNAYAFNEWMYYINSLRRPERSIKIFRVRSEYKGGVPTIEELAYDDNTQRLRFYQEIGSGERGLNEKDGGWEYYDRLDEKFSLVHYRNEYSNLINKENVDFNDFALVEFVIDRVRPNFITLKVKMDSALDNIYIVNNNSPETQYISNRNGCAFEVNKDIYDVFNDTIGTEFTSDATDSDVLTFEGKVKNSVLNGYWLFFKSTGDAVSKEAGVLTKTSNNSKVTYIRSSRELGRHRFDFINRIGQPWSRFEKIVSNYKYEDGLLTITLEEDFYKYIQYDKIKLLIEKSGGFNLSDVAAEYSGGIEKKTVVTPKFRPKQSFSELNDYQGFDDNWITAGNWINNGAVLKKIPEELQDYPLMHDKKNHVELGFDSIDGFSQSIEKTFPLEPHRGNRKVLVRVIARLFPKIYNTTKAPDEYHTNVRQIKADSYDMGTLVVAIKGSDGLYAPLKKPVDIGWSEMFFETYFPWNEDFSDFTIKLYRDELDRVDEVNYRNHLYPLQVYDVSVQIEGQ